MSDLSGLANAGFGMIITAPIALVGAVLLAFVRLVFGTKI
ncbi:hypothetical protein JDO7802_00843 [Jannaschia donghaensis]|uniref:Uncharacterized protein n=1 Tax=Jannaschia donghaensis TaxID=420998 RepID=A0A0M6YIF6_9RHOB|nr:hypothetical protein JDO7802_00843 [Jannaschia donghaensis]